MRASCLLLGALFVLLAGCDDAPSDPDAGAPPLDASGDAAAGTDASGADASVDAAAEDAGGADSGSPDGGVDVLFIDEVLRDCRRAGSAGVTAAGNVLSRVDVDLSAFPDARCVDGTGAVFYVRLATEAANADRWVVQLQGGGSCSTGDSCARRWCSVDTNFGADKMTSRLAPEGGTNAPGILAERAESPFQGWNHVFVHYCSSDTWTGRQSETELEATHPTTGEPVRYRASFLGASILDAVVDTLRRDGVPAVSYTDAGGAVREMPDMDDAVEVVLAGASAGGSGVIYNLDRLASRLRTTNTGCTAGACPLRTWGIIDSIYGVGLDRLDFSTSVLCTAGRACTWQEFTLDDYDTKQAVWAAELEDTCESWHDSMSTGEGYRCVDGNYLVEHHVTTPFVLRMGLTDSLIAVNAAERGFTVPERGGAELDVPLFAELVAEQLLELPNLLTTANEASSMERAPGVYGPRCPKHETLSSGPDTYDVRVDVGGTPVSFPQLIDAWLVGGADVAVASGASVCP